MIRLLKKGIVFILFFLNVLLHGQVDEKNTISQQVTVIKKYHPSVKDFDRIKIKPQIEDSLFTTTKKLKYSIAPNILPSRFTVKIGQPLKLEKIPLPNVYHSFASLGYGFFQQLNGNLYTGFALGKKRDIGIRFNYYAQNQNIPNVKLPSTRENYQASILYTYKKRSRSHFDINTKLYHTYYELYLYGLLNEDLTPDLFALNPKRDYSQWEVTWDMKINALYSGIFNRKINFLKDIGISYNRFDTRGSYYENLLKAQMKMSFNLNLLRLKISPSIDYFGNSYFKTNTDINSTIIYALSKNQLLFELTSPKKWDYKLGLNYVPIIEQSGADVINPKNNDYVSAGIYPYVEISYNSRNKWFTFFKLYGDTKLNSYALFSNENPYLNFLGDNFPNLRFTGFYNTNFGFRYEFSPKIEALLDFDYGEQYDFPLFKRIPADLSTPSNPFLIGNSFGVVYDNIRLLSVRAKIISFIKKKSNVILSVQYDKYTMTNEEKPWNLPSIKATGRGSFKLKKKWHLQTELEFLGGARSST